MGSLPPAPSDGNGPGGPSTRGSHICGERSRAKQAQPRTADVRREFTRRTEGPKEKVRQNSIVRPATRMSIVFSPNSLCFAYRPHRFGLAGQFVGNGPLQRGVAPRVPRRRLARWAADDGRRHFPPTNGSRLDGRRKRHRAPACGRIEYPADASGESSRRGVIVPRHAVSRISHHGFRRVKKLLSIDTQRDIRLVLTWQHPHRMIESPNHWQTVAR